MKDDLVEVAKKLHAQITGVVIGANGLPHDPPSPLSTLVGAGSQLAQLRDIAQSARNIAQQAANAANEQATQSALDSASAGPTAEALGAIPDGQGGAPTAPASGGAANAVGGGGVDLSAILSTPSDTKPLSVAGVSGNSQNLGVLSNQVQRLGDNAANGAGGGSGTSDGAGTPEDVAAKAGAAAGRAAVGGGAS